jgi:hypothetical protein
MYLHTVQGFGQAELPSVYGTPCLQDEVGGRLKAAMRADTLSKNLDDFFFRSPALRTWHKTWIKQQFVPAIVASERTSKPVRKIILVGDADEIGEPAFNYKLGKARAEAVSKELTKQIELRSRGLASKIAIEVYSRGECWPAVKSAKKEGRNRRVEVFGVKEEPSTPVKPTPQPGKPPKVPNIREIPETTKQRIEEKDRQTLEQKRYDAIPGLPPGMSIRDWIEKMLARLPKWLRTKIADAVVSGACSLLAALMEQGGLSQAEKEALTAACKASAQTKSR